MSQHKCPKGTPNQHTKVKVGRVCHWRPLAGGPIACEGPFFADDRSSADEPRVTCGNCRCVIEDAASAAEPAPPRPEGRGRTVVLTPSAVLRLSRDLGLLSSPHRVNGEASLPEAPRSPYNASGGRPGPSPCPPAPQAFPGQPGAFPALPTGRDATAGAFEPGCEHDFCVFSGTCARCGAGAPSDGQANAQATGEATGEADSQAAGAEGLS